MEIDFISPVQKNDLFCTKENKLLYKRMHSFVQGLNNT
jgi:hypothetical protein